MSCSIAGSGSINEPLVLVRALVRSPTILWFWFDRWFGQQRFSGSMIWFLSFSGLISGVGRFCGVYFSVSLVVYFTNVTGYLVQAAMIMNESE